MLLLSSSQSLCHSPNSAKLSHAPSNSSIFLDRLTQSDQYPFVTPTVKLEPLIFIFVSKMGILVGVIFFLVIILFLRTRKFFLTPGLHPWILPAVFALKCGAGLLFLQIYIFQHENPELKNDAGAFYHEAQILNSVYDESPSDYFKLLSSIGATEALSEKYLGETNHWDSGKQAVFHDNRNIIRVHAIISYISFGSIVVHMLIFSLISLIGIFLLFLALKRHSVLKPWVIIALLTLLPNLLFFSSGILKEPIIIFGIGSLAFGLIGKTKKDAPLLGLKRKNKRILFILLGLIALLLFKPYIFIILLAAGLVFLIYSIVPKRKLLSALGISTVLGMIVLFSFPSILQTATHFMSRKQFDFSNVGRGGLHVRSEPDSCYYYFTPEQFSNLTIEGDSVWLKNDIDACKVTHGDLVPPTPIHLKPNQRAWRVHFDHPKANSFIEISPIDDKPIRLLTSAPQALFNALIRPLPNDPGGKLKHIAFLETLLLFGLITWTILRHKKISSKERGFILSVVVFCILLALLIGWTTPVLGAIHRYRLPIQLAMICCVIIAWKPNIQILKK